MSLTREQYLNTISPIRILRDYGSKGPQILNENEKNRLKEIEKESTKSAFSLKTAILYNEYQTLRIKEKGKWDFHTIFEIIGSFFDERNLKAFKYFSSFVPTETEGDQYGCWDRKLLGEYTLQQLYAYFMHIFLLKCDSNKPFEKYTDYMFEDLAKYAHDHVLGPADIMMAKAGDSSRAVSQYQLERLFR